MHIGGKRIAILLYGNSSTQFGTNSKSSLVWMSLTVRSVLRHQRKREQSTHLVRFLDGGSLFMASVTALSHGSLSRIRRRSFVTVTPHSKTSAPATQTVDE